MVVSLGNEIFEAEFFDGQSPLSMEGTVVLCEEYLQLEQNNAEPVRFTYDEVLEVGRQGDRTRVLLKGDEKNTFHQILLVDSPCSPEHFQEKILHGKMNFFSAIRRRIQFMPTGKLIFFALFVAAFMISGYFLAIYQAHHVTPLAVDRYLGHKLEEYFLQNFKQCEAPELEREIETVGKKLIPTDSPFQYRFRIINEPTANAFALPGGVILIHSGLLEASGSFEEVAGILAHEISHVEQRHGIQKLIRVFGFHYLISMIVGAGFEEFETLETISEITDLLIFLNYSRDTEKEADKFAVDLLHEQSISVSGLKDFFDRNDKSESKITNWFSTHPTDQRRINFISKILKKETFTEKTKLLADRKWSRLKKSCKSLTTE